MVVAYPTTAEVWDWLKQVADPEIPVLSVIDLGIIRDVESSGNELVVTITPTYCGCPAMEVIASDIRSMLAKHGVDRVAIHTQLSPAWTTDWMSDDAKARLREYGIAPPSKRVIDVDAIVSLKSVQPEAVACPQCGSVRTEMVSRFGSTPCKALYKCLDCLEPFDAFKQH
jgi:ring-1,2-phenylacetyl-CoA epoxidase subunit PaaD